VPLEISRAAPTEQAQAYADAGYAVFEEPTRTLRAHSMLVRTSESLGRTVVAPGIDVPRGAVRVAGGAALRGAPALELLESWGIPIGTGAADEHEEGADLSVAIERDPTFGPIVTLGLSGELARVLDDRAVRLAPFGEDEARRMIDELRGSKLLAALDRDALARLLSRLSGLAAAEADTLASAELSPVRLLPVGRGVRVLGAIVTSSRH
jgi:acyl-CoA synthetase (NDP forming)